jgi:hypothetical protein
MLQKSTLMSMFCEVCEFSMLTKRIFLEFRFKEVTSLNLVHFYVVLMVKSVL